MSAFIWFVSSVVTLVGARSDGRSAFVERPTKKPPASPTIGRGHRWRRAAALAGLAAIALALIPGCSQEQQRPWAERAMQWIEARDRAAHRSVAELSMFEAADSVHLLCCNQAGPIQGRVENAEFLAETFGDTIDEETMGRSYIDVSGAVVEYRFRAGADDDRPARGGNPPDPIEL